MEHYKFLNPETILKKYNEYIQEHIHYNSKTYDFAAQEIKHLSDVFPKPLELYEQLQNNFQNFKTIFLSIHSIVLEFQKQLDFTFCYENLFIDTKYIHISNFIPKLLVRYKQKNYTFYLDLNNQTDINIPQELIPLHEMIKIQTLENIDANIFKSCIFDSNKLQSIFKSIINEFTEYHEYVANCQQFFTHCSSFSTYLGDNIDFIFSNGEKDDLECLFNIYYDTEITLELIHTHPLLKYYTGKKSVYSLDFSQLFNDLYIVSKMKKEMEQF